LNVARTRDRGPNVTSASGTVFGPTASSRTDDVSAGANATFNASKTFDISANQRLLVGGFVDYRSQRTDYDPITNLLAAGFVSTSSIRRDIYTLGGGFHYDIGDFYLGGVLGGDWGGGDVTTNTAPAAGGFSTGSFTSHGFMTAANFGKVFTLFDSVSYASPRLLTKAPPKPVAGSTLKLDLSGYVGYKDEQISGFVDSSGFWTGVEQLNYSFAGVRAKLYLTWVDGRLTWMPFVTVSADRQFAYSHTLNIPNQPAQAADILYFGSAQSSLRTELGIDFLDVSGVRYGISGYYSHSSEIETVGGKAYVVLPMSYWLNAFDVARKN
jgi:hypothetical protein